LKAECRENLQAMEGGKESTLPGNGGKGNERKTTMTNRNTEDFRREDAIAVSSLVS
jgi:hypothetical protein